MRSLGRILNDLADPDNIPRLFSLVLGIVLIAGLIVPFALNDHQTLSKTRTTESD